MNNYGQPIKPFIKKLLVVIIIVFILSIIPLFVIGQYAHPSADDYTYGLLTAKTWSETSSITRVFSSALQQVYDSYIGWQGTYSAIFLMSLQPGIFNEGLYVLTPIVLLFSVMVSTLFLLKVILMDYMGSNIYNFYIISISILFFLIQYIYSPAEGYFWYNGGIYYTFFYSLNLIQFCLLLLFLRSKHLYSKVIYIIVMSILGLIIAGGNYSTALNTVILLFFITVYLAIKRNIKFIPIGVVLFITSIGLFISISAPGNSVRQAIAGQPHAVKAVLLSFVYGLYSICNSTTVPIIILWLFLLPFIYRIARNSKFTFKHPIIFIILSFCIYCAQATPTIYALGISLPERLINIIYFSYYILILSDLFYLSGWASKNKRIDTIIQKVLSIIIQYKKQFCVGITAALFVGIIGTCSVSKGTNGMVEFRKLPASASAVLSLLNGDAKSYDSQVKQRISKYRDTSLQEIETEDYSAKPSILYYADITEDTENWINKAIAKYYGKISVRLQS